MPRRNGRLFVIGLLALLIGMILIATPLWSEVDTGSPVFLTYWAVGVPAAITGAVLLVVARRQARTEDAALGRA